MVCLQNLKHSTRASFHEADFQISPGLAGEFSSTQTTSKHEIVVNVEQPFAIAFEILDWTCVAFSCSPIGVVTTMSAIAFSANLVPAAVLEEFFWLKVKAMQLTIRDREKP